MLNKTLYYMKKVMNHSQVRFIPTIQKQFSFRKSVNMIHMLIKKEPKVKLISTNAKKIFDTIQNVFLILEEWASMKQELIHYFLKSDKYVLGLNST